MNDDGYSRYGPERDAPGRWLETASEPLSVPRELLAGEGSGGAFRRLGEALRSVTVSCREATEGLNVFAAMMRRRK